MPPHRVTFGKSGIVNIPDGIGAHAEPLHDRPRAAVARRGERYGFLKRENVEAEGERQAGRLGRIAMSPKRKGEPAADLNRRGEMGVKSRPRQSGKSDERCHTRTSQ